MSNPTVYINKKENYFKNKRRARAFFIKYDRKNKCYYYEIEINLDMKKVVRSTVVDLCVSLSESKSNFKVSTKSNFGEYSKNRLISTASVLAKSKAEMVVDIVGNQNKKKHKIKIIKPREFIDLRRYKENFRGTDGEKFGFTKIFRSIPAPKTRQQINEKVNNSKIPTVIRLSKLKNVEKLLMSGHSGLVDILDFSSVVSKKAKTHHRITEEEQIKKEQKCVGHDHDLNIKGYSKSDAAAAQLPERMVVRQKATVSLSSATVRPVRFLLKIKEIDIKKSKVDVSNFCVLLEARDKNKIVLDRQLVEINLKKDILMSKTTLRQLVVKSEQDKKDFTVNLFNPIKSTSNFKFHYKRYFKDIPFYKSYFTDLTATAIPAGSKNAAVVLRKSGQKKGVGSQNTSRKILNGYLCSDPMIVRVTPSISGFDFDNMYEFVNSPSPNFDNRHIPMAVLIQNKDRINLNNKIVIDYRYIPIKYKKVRVMRRNLNSYVFSQINTMKSIVSSKSDKTPMGFVNIPAKRGEKNSFLEIYDYGVSDGEFYEYRLELLDDVGRVEKIYSSNSFQEGFSEASNLVKIGLEASTSNNNVLLRAKLSVRDNDANKILNAVGNPELVKIFEKELNEIRERSGNSLIAGVERIDVDSSQVDFLGYLQDSNANFNSNTQIERNTNAISVSLRDDIVNSRSYYYKVTAYAMPVVELISAINYELESRGVQIASNRSFSAGRSLESHVQLIRKIKSLDTKVLSTISTKYSSKEKKIGKIIDPQTRASLNNGDVYASAATGDVGYVFVPSKTFAKLDKNNIFNDTSVIKRVNVNYYESKAMNNRDASVNEVRNKFIITFNAKFSKSIDHCAIFVENNGAFDHSCNMHVDHKKEQYRILVEKNNLSGRVNIMLHPVDIFGQVGSRVILCSKEVGK